MGWIKKTLGVVPLSGQYLNVGVWLTQMMNTKQMVSVKNQHVSMLTLAFRLMSLSSASVKVFFLIMCYVVIDTMF